ncbi:hypothetical protein F7731_05555 [Cytobacillus depressus]|uniref:PepSY domain-containing protein n=1 Tax=Cytobacillus depressus TaxID=1602942 RepID=A0A6L3V6M2_9BACI|nr:PepSY domain-containing protein [Cytobacillus depressus]KAB2337092.1 hypothetical protein F7731_05555 [Cytobacillus depressus]
MKKKRTFWILITLLAAVILFIIFQQWGPQLKPAAEILSEKEAKALVEERYSGEVIGMELHNNQYKIEMKRNKSNYEINLNAKNGKIISFSERNSSVIGSNQEHQNKENLDEMIPKLPEKPKKEEKVIIKKEEAIKIALKQIKGKIDDVNLESNGSLNYYLVEIETKDDKEVTVQINAITGEVISITSDD